MKTNVTLLSPDRELFGIKIRQESKTGHLNLSDLQAAYAVAQQQHGWGRRDAYEVLNTQTNAERIFYILQSRDMLSDCFPDASIKPEFPGFMELIEKQGVTSILKKASLYKTTGRGTNKNTWCDPYIWVLIAMELNPMLYAKTVVWLTDQLLFNRIAAGTNYRSFAEALARIGVKDFSRFGKALNYVVFGTHKPELRNMATAEQLQALADLEDKITFLVKMGFVRNQEQALNTLRRMWYDRPGNPFHQAA